MVNRDEHIEADVDLLSVLRLSAVGAESNPGSDLLPTGCAEAPVRVS